jgi:hypothetical protein
MRVAMVLPIGYSAVLYSPMQPTNAASALVPQQWQTITPSHGGCLSNRT